MRQQCKYKGKYKIVHFKHSYESIFNGVKEETTYLAERTLDNEGKQMYEFIVLDEEYPTMFRNLFFEAQAVLTKSCNPYIKEEIQDEDKVVIDADKLDEDRDYNITLFMPMNFKTAIVRPVNTLMRKLLVSYVCFRWLLHKLPREAELFKELADLAKAEIKSSLEVRTERSRLPYRYGG